MHIDLLNLKPELRIETIGSKTYVFDPIRKKNVILLPEELTRQLLVAYLIKKKKYRPALLQVEKKIMVNGFERRYDIISFDRSFNPFLLVECKSHKVKIKPSTFEQISRYNLNLKAKYLIVCNGMTTFCHHIDYINQQIILLDEIPSFV